MSKLNKCMVVAFEYVSVAACLIAILGMMYLVIDYYCTKELQEIKNGDRVLMCSSERFGVKAMDPKTLKYVGPEYYHFYNGYSSKNCWSTKKE